MSDLIPRSDFLLRVLAWAYVVDALLWWLSVPYEPTLGRICRAALPTLLSAALFRIRELQRLGEGSGG